MATKSVLLVDDDLSVRLSLPPVLASSEVEVCTAASFEEAASMLEASTFDLVITDLRLSGTLELEGLELIERIKRRSPGSEVVLLTGFGSAELTTEAIKRGATETWEKSISIQEIVVRVRALGIPVAVSGSYRSRSS